MRHFPFSIPGSLRLCSALCRPAMESRRRFTGTVHRRRAEPGMISSRRDTAPGIFLQLIVGNSP